MRPEADEPPVTFLIGPGIEDPGDVSDDPRCTASPQLEGRRLILRLIIAFLLVVAIALVCFVVLPRAGLSLPVWVPLAAFAAIAVGVLVNAQAEGQLSGDAEGDVIDRGCGPDGRPIGCCPGPRPPRFLREPPRRP